MHNYCFLFMFQKGVSGSCKVEQSLVPLSENKFKLRKFIDNENCDHSTEREEYLSYKPCGKNHIEVSDNNVLHNTDLLIIN
jgi:hypothetical protein